MHYWIVIAAITIILWQELYGSASGERERGSSLRGGETSSRGKKSSLPTGRYILPRCNDCSKLFRLPATFTVKNVKYTYAHVSTNGYIVLWPEKPRNVSLPHLPPVTNLQVPLLAPFWMNITTKINTRSRSFRPTVLVYTQKSAAADTAISTLFGIHYSSKRSFAARWSRVTHAGSKSTNKTNSFEVVLTTDGEKTYVVFRYGRLSWTHAPRSPVYAMAGIDFGDNTRMVLPGSCTGAVTDLSNKTNVPQSSQEWNIKGTFVYRVDDMSDTDMSTSDTPSPSAIPDSPSHPATPDAHSHLSICTAGQQQLSPMRASLLGGSPITVTGPCFENRPVCLFDQIIVLGIVVNPNKAICVTPIFARVGSIPVSVSLNGGDTFTPEVEFSIDAGVEKELLQVQSNGREMWGNLQAPSERIEWPKSYFRTRFVNVVYMMLKQNNESKYVLVTLKKAVPNTGSVGLQSINLRDQATLQAGFVGALGIQEYHSNDTERLFGLPITMWSAIHPAWWYYNMYVNESIMRAKAMSSISATLKSKYILAAEAELNIQLWRLHNVVPFRAILQYFTDHAAEINEHFFKELCDDWFAQELAHEMPMNHLPGCPCTLDVAQNDGRFHSDVVSSLGQKHNMCLRTQLAEGGDQQCCYGHTGELLQYAEGGGSVSRFSATRQPLLYMLQDHWPKIMCGQLAYNIATYDHLRPTDDCSEYLPPS